MIFYTLLIIAVILYIVSLVLQSKAKRDDAYKNLEKAKKKIKQNWHDLINGNF